MIALPSEGTAGMGGISLAGEAAGAGEVVGC
jgi:hypothetical protein